MEHDLSQGRVGIAIVGLAGAVGTTVAAGLELFRQGEPATGMIMADVASLVPYQAVEIDGWDVTGSDLATAASQHGVLTDNQLKRVEDELRLRKPRDPLTAGRGVGEGEPLRAQVDRVTADIAEFQSSKGLDSVVVVYLGPTEPLPSNPEERWPTLGSVDQAIDSDDSDLPVSSLYAYAAVSAGAGYVNFTPGLGADIPGILQFAGQRGIPLAGRDGKTGQTMLKTVLAPAFRARGLRVRGWYSLNLLGNGDGLTLRDPDAKSSKISTKTEVLDHTLGYSVDDHIVHIDYYAPRGDAKEAWDSIDIEGFLGQPMQIKVNFLCRDSILAAPIVIELARCLDLAMRRGESGVVQELGFFFKSPMQRDDSVPCVHDLFEQQAILRQWLNAPLITGGSK